MLYKHIYAKRITLRPLGALVDILDQVCYNKFLREHNMSEAKQALYAVLAQLQLLTDLDDDAMQTAISNIAQTIEDVVA